LDNLATPNAVRRIMESHGLHFRKSLGQNFLIDGNIRAKIVQAAEIKTGEQVLEIGPGVGTLTQALAEAGARVVAVEIDKQLVEVLHHTMRAYPQVQVVQGDALHLDLNAFLPEQTGYKVVANLPYYITSPLLMRLYEELRQPEIAVVMVQKEVAQRLTAQPGSKDYGALSINIAYYADATVVANAPKTVFMPAPNVDSSVVKLTSRPFPYPAADARTFSATVRAAFGQRRKTLRNTLRTLVNDPTAVLNAAGIDGSRRGETLSIEEYGRLSLAVQQALDS
jgi:16S rRNA (adenine1518-N6/adenine1519-N6)-dimethyltransferase